MPVVQVREAVNYSKEYPSPNMIFNSAKLRVLVLGLEAGQSIPAHPSAEAFFYVVEGRGLFTVGEEEKEVGAGSLVVAPDGVKRGMKATEKLLVVATQAS